MLYKILSQIINNKKLKWNTHKKIIFLYFNIQKNIFIMEYSFSQEYEHCQDSQMLTQTSQDFIPKKLIKKYLELKQCQLIRKIMLRHSIKEKLNMQNAQLKITIMELQERLLNNNFFYIQPGYLAKKLTNLEKEEIKECQAEIISFKKIMKHNVYTLETIERLIDLNINDHFSADFDNFVENNFIFIKSNVSIFIDCNINQFSAFIDKNIDIIKDYI